ncbi:MAG: efflux RND transporter periplasmic adaptor subunit [Gemmataceae bacterium]
MNQLPTTSPLLESESSSVLPAVSPLPPHAAKNEGSRFFKALKSVGLLLIAAVVLVIFLGFILGVRIPGMSAFAHAEDKDFKIEPPPRLGVELVKDQPHTLQVPEEVRAALGIRKGGKDRIEVVKVPTTTRPLNLYGSTALDNTHLARIRARFAPCEVRKIGEKIDSGKRTETGETAYRELRPGDEVKKGDVLGVFFSVDVGSKKNDLLDALVQYLLDQRIYDNMTKYSSSIPQIQLDTQWSKVQSDRNAINRALHNLEVWNIPQDEIDALHAEAKKLSADKDAWFKTPEGRWVKGEKQGTHGQVDVDKENENPWARVTLRAPFDGIIVERNLAVHEIVVDNTVNLFQIAQVNRLQVIAHAPEDELPTLNALTPEQRVWSVRTVGPVPISGLKGPIDEIGYLIDPNQHTAVIKGYIDNLHKQIRAGQFVSCTIQLPPPRDVVEVPIDAVVEDGKYCVVFVQPDPVKPYFTMRRVQLTHRFEKTAFVRSKPFAENERLTDEEKEMGLPPREPLRPGERILLSGVGELKAALIDLESRPTKR